MKLLKKISEISKVMESYKENGKTVGLVPTMGALHIGHLSLVEKAVKDCDVVVASVFVNPIQFNNPDDLKKYPRDLERDMKMLEEAGCDYVFSPEVKEMYPETPDKIYEFHGIDKEMEGKFRPGHFNGVATVVHRLFDIIGCDKAYFGEKDFQQLAIVNKMVQEEGLNVDVVSCSIIRESNGLAMSSRNERLNEKERKLASAIYSCLLYTKEMALEISIDDIKKEVEKRINAVDPLKLEYFEIVDDLSLELISKWGEKRNLVACIAVWCGEVRLIDNIRLFS
ncbi:MAG: pantoate--beta-alanine ligase [Hyphomicrobiales bacterium]